MVTSLGISTKLL